MADTALTNDTHGLWQLFTEYLAPESLELDDLEIAGSGSGRVVRVVVDATGGVGVDRLAETSRALSRLLDDQDPFDGAYTLEVTSPGLERKLRRPAHYQKSIGRTVTVKTTDEIEGQRRHDGDLAEVDQHGIVIDAGGHSRRIEFEQIASARTVFEWKRNPKPGKSG